MSILGIFEMELTQERLKEILDYDPTTGIFAWKIRVAKCIHIGDIAGLGSHDKGGYSRFTINRKIYYAHRLAFFYMTGSWPKEEIDHVNGITDDNRWFNLREATHSQNKWNRRNSKNNKSGQKGVFWFKPLQKWRVMIWQYNKPIFLGYFFTFEEAKVAYQKASLKYQGEFALLRKEAE